MWLSYPVVAVDRCNAEYRVFLITHDITKNIGRVAIYVFQLIITHLCCAHEPYALILGI